MLFIHKLRAVPEHQRALAVGTNGFAASLSGTWQNILKTSSGEIFDFSLSLVKTTVAFQTSLKTVCDCRCLHTKPFSLMVNPPSMFSTDCSRRCSSQLLLISLMSCMVCVFQGFWSVLWSMAVSSTRFASTGGRRAGPQERARCTTFNAFGSTSTSTQSPPWYWGCCWMWWGSWY